MSVTKDFVAKIAVGIRGIALLEITETLSLHSAHKGNHISNDFIVDHISENGIEEWAEHNLTDMPVEPGIYTFRGSARFDEDGADYTTTCDDI